MMFIAVETLGRTVIEIVLLVAVDEVTHVKELVTIQLTTSPFCRVVELKVALFVPTLIPFTFHW